MNLSCNEPKYRRLTAFLWSLGINTLVLVIAFAFSHMEFGTNDDRDISNLLANVNDSPNAHYITFVNVILTKGLTSLIVSAKTARFNREHLYEIKYLTERFSLNSKPVIVYASTQKSAKSGAADEMHAVKQRARAMGVYLIDLNELAEQNESLGSRLAAIADGTAPL